MKNVSKVFKNVLCQLEITKYMARIDQLDNRLMKIEEQCQPTPSLDHAASRLVKIQTFINFFEGVEVYQAQK